MIAPDTACVVVGESGGVPEYAEVVNEASAVCETKDEDVNTIDNGDACQKQCYDEEGVEYGNGSYVTSNYYPMDEYVNEPRLPQGLFWVQFESGNREPDSKKLLVKKELGTPEREKENGEKKSPLLAGSLTTEQM
ncbi:hypothetical protein PC116_g23813 [Phytophthora cactorum]|uniref:Uncharacterized protein n=1 Tax=Phytophthora cactorum TaxID=29920 RepID=A0A329RHN5_9STRA|nr:hypothetical protein PC116_g23813 [Phytophthora cactorum]RAW23930.1 hypothetical protein PC110_g19638 [Phytophthora cactorum]